MDSGHINQTSLYYQDAAGGIRVWSIRANDFELFMEHGTLGGEIQEKIESIHYGIGGRTRLEQLMSRYSSRINSKVDKGYVYSIEEAKANKPVNKLGLKKPMLAHPIQKVKNINYRFALAQYKYDGHRCLINCDGGVLTPYSRNGKAIETIGHILEGLELPDGVTIDGELYIHGYSLQKISSIVKRKGHPENCKLTLKIYDVISNQVYSDRFDFLNELKMGNSANIAPTWSIAEDEIDTYFETAIDLGYEGLIIRVDGLGYEDGKRSKGLLKVKSRMNEDSFMDDEFIVVDVLASVDGWGRLVCTMKDGTTFKTPAPGTMEEKTDAFVNKNKYIGRHVNVKYAGFTDSGKPFHPIATGWRNKAGE